MSGIVEYRDDDVIDRGFCPRCGKLLSGITIEGRGLCEKHGWVFADWGRLDEEEEGNDE